MCWYSNYNYVSDAEQRPEFFASAIVKILERDERDSIASKTALKRDRGNIEEHTNNISLFSFLFFLIDMQPIGISIHGLDLISPYF